MFKKEKIFALCAEVGMSGIGYMVPSIPDWLAAIMVYGGFGGAAITLLWDYIPWRLSRKNPNKPLIPVAEIHAPTVLLRGGRENAFHQCTFSGPGTLIDSDTEKGNIFIDSKLEKHEPR